jgi:hypothetical protein
MVPGASTGATAISPLAVPTPVIVVPARAAPRTVTVMGLSAECWRRLSQMFLGMIHDVTPV